ncbi:hypothetical protein HYPSUDRAFT_207027 [Hypholoma sublateritium FD-334 SS-4]|uniref:Uncharacterized protein n=1 Tax=Hypholoma sublateritium (strain FD-334 SS-4) TaxID=945553 RepID=A0A0D2KP89_HYPSF|nr:hypothetical protein HYPSUDRAFT_207027 [Hypholoma sublateritium FD-334 SS-4]
MSQSFALEETMPTAAATSATATPATAISACASTATPSSGYISAIFGPEGSSAATARPCIELNGLYMDQQVFNLLVANEKIIRDQRNEIMRIRTELLRLRQTSQRVDCPAATAPPQLAHVGIDPDATIVLPRRRKNIHREDTVLFDAMDTL